MAKQPPKAPQVRFRVDPAYAPADKIARRLCLTESQFRDCARRLYARGFPLPDETTGMYDLEAVDRWRMRQRPDLYPEFNFAELTPPQALRMKSSAEKELEYRAKAEAWTAQQVEKQKYKSAKR